MRGLGRLFSCCLVAGLFGCTNPAPVPERVHIEDIIHNIRCELYETVWGGWSNKLTTGAHPWLSKWNAAVTLRLQVDRNAGIAGTATYTVPVQVGIFTIGFAGGIDKAANNATSIDYTVRLKDLAAKVYENCAHLGTAYYSERPPKLLAGNLGLRDWIDRSALALERTAEETQTTGLTYVVDFVISAAAELTPSIMANRLTKPYSASLTVAGARKDTHRMTVVFSKPGRADKTHADIIEAINQISAKIDADERAYNRTVAQLAGISSKIDGLRSVLLYIAQILDESPTLNMTINEFRSDKEHLRPESPSFDRNIRRLNSGISRLSSLGAALEDAYRSSGIRPAKSSVELMKELEKFSAENKGLFTKEFFSDEQRGLYEKELRESSDATIEISSIANLARAAEGGKLIDQLSQLNQAQARLSSTSLIIARDRAQIANLRANLPQEGGLDRTEFLQLREALSSSIILP